MRTEAEESCAVIESFNWMVGVRVQTLGICSDDSPRQARYISLILVSV